jgi:hypothetical protein
MAIPGKTFLEIFKSTLNNNIDINGIYKNEKLRKSVLQDNWLPFDHNILIENIPFHKKNELFKDTAEDSPNDQPFMTIPLQATIASKYIKSRTLAQLLNSKGKKALALTTDPRYSYQESDKDLLKHNKIFEKKYLAALKQINEIKASKEYKKAVSLSSKQKQEGNNIINPNGKTKASEYVEFISKMESILNKELEETREDLRQGEFNKQQITKAAMISLEDSVGHKFKVSLIDSECPNDAANSEERKLCTWQQANDKCTDMNMILPNRGELAAIEKNRNIFPNLKAKAYWGKDIKNDTALIYDFYKLEGALTSNHKVRAATRCIIRLNSEGN